MNRFECLGINYMDEGHGGTVLLLHGFMFDATMWTPQIRALDSAGYRVIAPDLPGFGRSLPPTAPVSMRTYSAAVSTLMAHLRLRTAAVIGYSMGGQVAMDLCAHEPGLLSGMMLVDTTANADTAEHADRRRALAARLEREGVREYAHEFLPQLLHLENATPRMRKTALAMLSASNPDGAAAASRARADRAGYLETLAHWDRPVHVVVGEHDPFDRQGAGSDIADQALNGHLTVIPGVGHTPPIEAPEAFNRLLLEFVRRTQPDAAT